MDVDKERSVRAEIVVPARAGEVWEAWTTEEGVRSFFAPACDIQMTPGGRYEIYFNPEEEPGKRGAEECIVLATQPGVMLSFTWNAPPELPRVRFQHTHVVVRFEAIGENETRVRVVHDGFGLGGEDHPAGDEWDKAYEYFQIAWGKVVLPRLKYRFEHGPIDWKNRPKP